MINKLNVYQVLFAALLLLKIGEVGKFADFSWWVVFAPYMLGCLHSLLMWTFHLMEIPDKFRQEAGIIYLDTIRKRATKRALKRIQKEQEEAFRNRQN